MNSLFRSRRLLALISASLLASLAVAPWSSRGDDAKRKHREMENRFLFIIDTASAMRSRSQGVYDAVNYLLLSDMQGELRKGDTIGFWAYNDQLDTDFPMEVWSEDKKDSILQEMRRHVNHLRYTKRAHLEKALPSIKGVVENSERVTIILIFDGADPIKGTPFDKDINQLHKRYAAEFRSSSEPFVTVMAARNGAVFDYTINYPATVVIPHTADPLPPPVETNSPAIVVTEIPAPAPAPPPIEPAPTTPSTNRQIVLSGANFVNHEVVAPTPLASVTTPAEPAPATAPAAVTNFPPVENAPVATQQTVDTNIAMPASQPAPPPAGDSTASSTPSTPQPSTTTSASTAPAASSPPSTTSSAPPVVNPAKSSTEPASSATSTIPGEPAPVTGPKTTVPISTAVVAATRGELTAMFIMAFSLLTIAIVLVLFLVRRWRNGPQPSLISQSIDRPH